MAIAKALHEGEPLMEMNTTPLIDVMLVLLVMFIITIPIQTHAVKVDLPNGPSPRVDVRPDRNLLEIAADGGLRWNGTSIDREGLAAALAHSKTFERPPELHFKPDALARYETVDEILSIIDRSGAPNMGFVGNEQYRNF